MIVYSILFERGEVFLMDVSMDRSFVCFCVDGGEGEAVSLVSSVSVSNSIPILPW